MSFVRRLARSLLAANFVSSGLDAALHPMNRAERARPLVERLAPTLRLPDDAELVVRSNGVLMVGAGLLLSSGRAPRLAALTLATSVLPATYVDHPFWVEKEPERRRAERTLFLKNLGLLGGLLLACVDTAGRPGLAWRGRHAAKDVRRAATQAARQAELTARLEAHSVGARARDARATARALLPG